MFFTTHLAPNIMIYERDMNSTPRAYFFAGIRYIFPYEEGKHFFLKAMWRERENSPTGDSYYCTWKLYCNFYNSFIMKIQNEWTNNRNQRVSRINQSINKSMVDGWTDGRTDGGQMDKYIFFCYIYITSQIDIYTTMYDYFNFSKKRLDACTRLVGHT